MRTPVRTADLVQLKVWSEHLCRLPETDPLRVVAVLRVGVAPSAYIRGVGRMERPPIGTSHCEISVAGNRLRALSFRFAQPSIAQCDLEDALGPGLPLRRTRPLSVHQLGYRVVVPGAPFSCDVVATFDESPRRHSLATAVVLRRRAGLSRAA